jgi:hypothetical protein
MPICAYPYLPVPICALSCLPVPTVPCRVVPTRVVSCVSVPYRACSCLFISCLHVSCLVVCRARVVPCFVSWRAVLGPLNRVCRAVSKMKKISHATFKNTTRDTCHAGTDRHACRAVSLSCRFVSCRALTRGHDFITLLMGYSLDMTKPSQTVLDQILLNLFYLKCVP